MAARRALMLFWLLVQGRVLCEPQYQTRVIYGAANGSVTFPVAASVAFKEILWRKRNYPVIQWDVHNHPEPRTFWPFLGRTSLDTESGDLSIFSLTHSDEGEYELESPDIKDDIKFRLEVIDPALQVDLVVPNATVPEKAAFQLDCSIVSRSSLDSQFAVAWFSLRTKVGGRKGRPGLEQLEEEEEVVDPIERTALLSVGHNGVFGPEGSAWEGRLCFQRLSPLLHRLTVLQARPQDTGNYSCRMEEWLPGPQGTWYRLTEQESAPVNVLVLDTGFTLQSIISKDTLILTLLTFIILLVLYLFLSLMTTILLLLCPFHNLITIWNHLDCHHHQELELQKELRWEGLGDLAMGQRATTQLLPNLPGASLHPHAQHPPRDQWTLAPD